MSTIQILRERNLTEDITLDDIKGGTMSGGGLCCISNTSCNKNTLDHPNV